MPKLLAQLDNPPGAEDKFAEWVSGSQHIDLLQSNAGDENLIMCAHGEQAFIHSFAIAREALENVSGDELLIWSSHHPMFVAGCFWGGGAECCAHRPRIVIMAPVCFE